MRLTSEIEGVAGPYVKRILAVLKYVVPIAAPAIEIATDGLAERLKSDLEAMEALAESRPDLNQRSYLSNSNVGTFDDARFRAMNALLLTLDPQRRWAGLNKVPTPEGNVYWLCGAHTDQFRGLPGEVATP